jgi:hypothetical protein
MTEAHNPAPRPSLITINEQSAKALRDILTHWLG